KDVLTSTGAAARRRDAGVGGALDGDRAPDRSAPSRSHRVGANNGHGATILEVVGCEDADSRPARRRPFAGPGGGARGGPVEIEWPRAFENWSCWSWTTTARLGRSCARCSPRRASPSRL